MLVFIAITFIYLLFSYKYPDFMFWLALTIFLDPGGYFFIYLSRSIIGGFQITDLNFVLLMVPLISPKVNIRSYFRTRDNQWMFYFILFYTIIYQGFIFGYVAPGFNTTALINTLQYQRLTMWGFLVILPTYIFFRRNYMLVAKFALVTSILLVLLYLTRILTGLKVIPFWMHNRGLGTGAVRIAMYSFGYAYWFPFIALVLYIFKLKIPKVKWIYFIGIVITFAIVLSLTRRSIIYMLFNAIVIYILRQKFYNKRIVSVNFGRIIISLGIVLIVLYFIAPTYINHSIAMIKNTFEVVSMNNEDEEDMDGRLEQDIPAHLARFKQSPVIGYGYDILWYSNNKEEGGLSANDVPLTAALGMFGVLGIFIFCIFYFKIIKILKNSYFLLKTYISDDLVKEHVLIFTLLTVFLVTFVARFTINSMSLFSELIIGKNRVSFFINLGVFLAASDILKNEFYKLKKK